MFPDEPIRPKKRLGPCSKTLKTRLWKTAIAWVQGKELAANVAAYAEQLARVLETEGK